MTRARANTKWVAAIAVAACFSAGDAAADPPHVDFGAFTRWLHSVIPLGDVNHKYVVDCPKVDDPRIGKSKCAPFALKIVVGEHGTGFPGGIGKVVHDALFPNKPTFTFKVVFAAAETDLLGRGNYANPSSIWYNVFFGYYEIDVPKRGWGRPFGYDLVGGRRTVRHDDLLRIGKADWNHFSNQLYGVPLAAINRQHLDQIDPRGVTLPPVYEKPIGAGMWDLVEIRGVEVVSPYRSKHDGQSYVDTGHDMPVWQYVFGRYDGDDPRVRASFLPSRMHGKFYMYFKEDRDPDTHEEIYRTFMFGGTVNEAYPDRAENERFLSLQMTALEHVIDREAGLGFPIACGGQPARCAHDDAEREHERRKRLLQQAREAEQRARLALASVVHSTQDAARALREAADAAKTKLREAEDAAKRAEEAAKKTAERLAHCLAHPLQCASGK